MSVELLELAAAALEPVLGEVVFLGGATVYLWITDPGAPPVRPTKDVDVVVEVVSRSDFHAFEQRLRSLRFDEDQLDGIICRWRHRDSGLILDAMPSDPGILGFSNRWQAAAIPHAVERELPSGSKDPRGVASISACDEARGVQRSRRRGLSREPRSRRCHRPRRWPRRARRRGARRAAPSFRRYLVDELTRLLEPLSLPRRSTRGTATGRREPGPR